MKALLLALLIVVVACGQKAAEPVAAVTPSETAVSEPESKTPSIDACAVLTTAEIVATFGELKEGPIPDTGLSKEKLCKFTNMEGSWLQTSLYGSDRWGWQKGMTSEMHPKNIAELGDEAFSVKRGTDSVVYVRKGGGVLEISCSCDLAKAETLAAKGAPRI